MVADKGSPSQIWVRAMSPVRTAIGTGHLPYCRHHKISEIKHLAVISLDAADSSRYRPPMRAASSLTVLVLASLLATSVWAAPDASAGDDMERMLADRGLIRHIGQVGQKVSNKASELVVSAMGFLGVPYKRGGNSAETGFDCSGFVRAIYQQTIGLMLPRTADQQAQATQEIDKSELQPGDLVFFNTLRRAFSHVGIYVGDNKFIHAPKPGAQVRVEDMRVGYWRTRFNGARRVDNTSSVMQP